MKITFSDKWLKTRKKSFVKGASKNLTFESMQEMKISFSIFCWYFVKLT